MLVRASVCVLALFAAAVAAGFVWSRLSDPQFPLVVFELRLGDVCFASVAAVVVVYKLLL